MNKIYALYLLMAIFLTSACHHDEKNAPDHLVESNNPESLNLEGVWTGKATYNAYSKIDSENFTANSSGESNIFIVIRKNDLGNYEMPNCSSGYEELNIVDGKFDFHEMKFTILNNSEMSGTYSADLNGDFQLKINENMSLKKLPDNTHSVGTISRNWSGTVSGISSNDIYCAEILLSKLSDSRGNNWNDTNIAIDAGYGHEYFYARTGTSNRNFTLFKDDQNEIVGSNAYSSMDVNDITENGFLMNYVTSDGKKSVSGFISINVLNQN